ncbi:MAG: hypothetical protein V9F46_05105 [Chitinophagaceae bacterium]
MKFTDPDGNFPWLAVGIVVLVGGITMRVAFVNNGGSFFNGFWRGALASGLSASFSGAIAGAMPGLGGSILAGSFGGFSGGGFSTLLNGGDGSAMLQGLLTGGVGGAASAYFGGGRGAFIGGAVSGGVGSLLNGDNVLNGMLTGGATSFLTYHLANYINYSFSSINNDLTYNQFATIAGDYQRALARRVEFSGIAFGDGTLARAKAGDRYNLKSDIPNTAYRGKEVILHYHIHWDEPNAWRTVWKYGINDGNYASKRMLIKYGNMIKRIQLSNGPSPADFGNAKTFGYSILIDRYNFYKYNSMSSKIMTSYRFSRYNLFALFP